MDAEAAEKTSRKPGKKAATRARLMEVRAKRAAEREARERANITDLTEFFVQTELHDDVDGWLREQIAKATSDAKARRLQHRAAAAAALKAMLDRGETVSAIAEQAEITVAKVRTYLAQAGGAPAPEPQGGADDDPANGRAAASGGPDPHAETPTTGPGVADPEVAASAPGIRP